MAVLEYVFTRYDIKLEDDRSDLVDSHELEGRLNLLTVRFPSVLS